MLGSGGRLRLVNFTPLHSFNRGNNGIIGSMKARRKETRTYADRRKYMIKAVSKRRRAVKARAIEYKGGQCQICGYKKFQGALELHHTNPSSKNFGIGQYGHSRSWERVKQELDKCILLCANCHREVSAGMRDELINKSLAPGTGLEPAT